ncbi:MAG: putative LPS assembly protein LptD [Dysgonamonadaceae bacterium]|nr:putative LPS assembly protein LptD [Dysgonamonadaceae bacterium]MDD3727916.1 putative LPS assembly protein LptD [Dysgonamonadaceae bacterium]MDD4246156.1 putative LPS assembly protein LptD [Dysgonamonadaceae bacterium]MDD4606156.1 putative LPS assembly protein LptD [Dysgonamonadaceae bacterium]
MSNPQLPQQIIPADTTKTDTLSVNNTDTIPKKKEQIESTVNYSAQDSIVFTKDNKGFLYGDAEVKYQDIAIKGENITMNMDSSLIGATFGLDSVGKEFGYPIFEDKGTQYEMKNVRYNFKTEKAYISNVVTEQGEGYIVANQAKKNTDNSFYMLNAKYTTCDLHDHPHFYLNLSKAKVRPGKDVVTGPAWLVVADVPLFPLVLPFAFFPFNETYSSGIIMPSYGDEMERGFYLHNGGYYFALSDYIDLALTGEIYTKGTWGAGVQSNYRKRYKFSGNLNAYYMKTILGEKGMPDYSASTDFRVSWTHSQDPKANMYRTLSASVNYSTSSYNQRNLNTRYSRQATNNTKSSTVNLTQRFPNSPWNLSASASVNQVSRDSTISATLPNLSANMSRIYPLKRKDAIGEERWYEKISMSYSGEFRNSIQTKENEFMQANIIKDWQNGMRHSIPISATFTLMDYINISPSFNYNERWYSGKEIQQWDPIAQKHVVSDTIYGFNRVYDYNTSLSVNTKLYGMYTPLKMFGDKVQAIRHVFSPSISISYSPDFGAPRYNYYETYNYRNEYGEDMEYTYSPYSRMMFGAPSQGAQGNIGFDFKNNLEMKLRSEKDTTGYKKVSLIDDLGINFSYNMMADSMKWSMINTNMRLKLSKSYTLSLNATWDPYLYEVNENGRPIHVDKLRILNGKGFGKLYSTGTSFAYSINQDTFANLFGKKEGGDNENESDGLPDGQIDDGSLGKDPDYENPRGEPRSMFQQDETDSQEYDRYGYMRTGVNWNLSFNYSLRYGYGDFDFDKKEYKGKLTHSLGISGSLQPTKNWNFTFNTDYNFDLNKFTYVNCTLTRDLHCWTMSASFIPIGPYKSYNFIIRAKSSLLQDLKYDQRSSQYDNMEWY